MVALSPILYLNEFEKRSFPITDKNLISFSQFLRIMENRRPAHDLESEIEEAFRRFDKGGNGRVSMKELRRMMGQIGERLTEDELDDMMREADLNGDGQIDFKGKYLQ